ncbi:MAG: DNA polymerase ligase N-terminal domain-containing protein [Candidatus Aenigmatarchaeota archaeon]
MPIFVIHHHLARKEHWDLRLEFDNVLKSWALPKEPPTEKGIKRLAIQVEDHPLDYANFEGEIPKGFYGAGKVEIWDKGDYEIIKFGEDEIIFNLNGKKLKGEYILLKMKSNKFGKEKNAWLFFKR